MIQNQHPRNSHKRTEGGYVRSHLTHLALLATMFGPAALAQNAKSAPTMPKLKIPGPEAQNLMLGTYSTRIEYPPDQKMPKGAVASGTEIWRPGPGGYSVVEEYHEQGPAGNTEGFAIAWWDQQAQGQRFVWCDSTSPKSCSLSKSVAKWEGDRLVYVEEEEISGKKVVRSEIFSDITATSFTQTLKDGPSGAELRTVVTIHATKIGAN
jgi:hypothetical protein